MIHQIFADQLFDLLGCGQSVIEVEVQHFGNDANLVVWLGDDYFEDEGGGFEDVAVEKDDAYGLFIFLHIEVHGFFFFKRQGYLLLQVVDIQVFQVI